MTPPAPSLPTIGVLGAGPVGLGLAALLQDAGYAVTVGTRRPERSRPSPFASDLKPYEVAARMDVVVLAVVHNASKPLVAALEDTLAGKVVIDTDNAWIPAHRAAAGLSSTLTEGTWMSRLLPRSRVVRAFSHIDADKLVPFATAEPGVWAAAFAAEDREAAALTADLIHATGYAPVFLGALADSASIDPGGVLWSRMARPRDVARLLGRAPLPVPHRD